MRGVECEDIEATPLVEVRQSNIYDTGSVYMPSTFTSETRRRNPA